ncbi:MAG TPA: sialidase family protein [Bryobacteraceae bacterium]|nr:sialidase family protein [Bryobacteraceae bacterium]
MRRIFFCVLAGTVAFAPALSAGDAPKHKLVYREAGRFGGWPANHGIWSWGDEILVGFSAAYFKEQPPDRHQQDHDKPEEPRLARSLDGGETWTIEAPPGLLPPAQGGHEPQDMKKPMDFRHPGFAMTVRFLDSNTGPSLLWYSYDKGRTWKGPFRFPQFGNGVAARTDYLINGKRDALVFLTAAKSNRKEGRPFCVHTIDGGLTWKFVSFIGEEPKDGFAIMPSTVRLSRRELLTMVRVKDGTENRIDAYRSHDDGGTWQRQGAVADTGKFGGNPPMLFKLRDGRLCLTYGYRAQPYSIRALLSHDQGRTWGGIVTIRDSAATWELGYTRSVQRPDGKIVTVYYFNDAPHNERFIAATIWDPGH